MYKAKLSEAFWDCEKGDVLVLERQNAGQLLVMQKPDFCDHVPDYTPTGDAGTLIVRPGGMGDIVHLGPAIKQVAIRDGRKPDVCVATRYVDCVLQNPDVGNMVPYPLHWEDMEKYSQIHWLEDTVDGEKKLHMADAFLKGCGFDPDNLTQKEKRPMFFLDPDATPRVKRRRNKQRVGFQLKASAKCRTPTAKVFAPLVNHYAQAGWEVYIFGAPGEIQLDDELVKNTTQWTPSMSIMDSAVQMTTCDLFIAPDSGLLHVAGALGIPSVGLYGPFPAELRTKYTPKCIAVEGKAFCSPCFWHSRGRHFPVGCPTEKTGACGVLDAIDPQVVIDAGERVMRSI